MGTGPFAVPTCQRLLDEGHDIPVVVTRPLPDPPPKKLPPRPVYDWATQHGLELFEPASINTPEAITKLEEYAADLFFVCDYGQILSKACLSAAGLGGINLHGSILPRHRGAAPVQWALLRGDDETGVTVIHMTPRLDAGPSLSIRKTAIARHETAAELEPRLAELGVEATIQSIDLLAAWDGSSPLGEIQDPSLVTKAPRFAKSDGQLDFRLPAEYLVRLVRACQPWPGTFAELRWKSGKQIRLIVRAASHVAAHPPIPVLAEAPVGTVASVREEQLGTPEPLPWDEMLGVQTGEGVFLIGRVQPAGKREMDAQEFLRGHALDGGCEFVLPGEPHRMLSP